MRPAALAAAVFAWLSPAAADTGAQAAFEKGLAADYGPHGHSDPALAYRYYSIAAAQGDAEAELNVGVMNDSGVGTLADAVQAALWYARAASHGIGRAAFNLGQLYEAGEGVPQDRPLAAAWFERAAREGVDAAADRAARLKAALGKEVATDLRPPSPVVPSSGAKVVNGPVEFVWQPGAPQPGVHYWVQVTAIDQSPTTTLTFRSTDVSSLLIRLPLDGRFAWRIFAASPDAAHYRASGWTDFSVSAAASAVKVSAARP